MMRTNVHLFTVFCIFLCGCVGMIANKAPADEARVQFERKEVQDNLQPKINIVWANDGGDKVTQDELRASSGENVINSVWDGSSISLFGAKNEVVSFNLILESPEAKSSNVTLVFKTLSGPGGATISSKPASGNEVFNWVDRNIEMFYIRYLEIKGLSHDLCYNASYDERHIPKRFRRPIVDEMDGVGSWYQRPDHNKFYPDIAVPLELISAFTIPANNNQSIWVDIYIPKTTPAGKYAGTVTIFENGLETNSIPVSLDVKNFSLPDYPTAKTMLYYSDENINYRYLGKTYVDHGTSEYSKSLGIINRHFQMAHRHKISLIDNYTATNRMEDAWTARLSGSLFTSEKGYDGPGIGTGNNVYSIGTYGSWTYAWSENSISQMWTNSNNWVNWFTAKNFSTSTDFFLYLIDESDDYATQENWAQWLSTNPGSGKKLMSMATISNPEAWQDSVPSLDIPTSSIRQGITNLWENATEALVNNPGKRFYYYNGGRPASGTYAIEDDGIALRLNGWIQHKKKIDRWFYWEGTYYDNYQAGEGQTDVFSRAQTYGSFDGFEPYEDDEEGTFARGEYGWNYTNGDGVLFYPGTDKHYINQSYGVDGPFASLRLKHWRRGIQDADYLALANKVNPLETIAIVNKMLPKVLWEYGVENEIDPTYVYTDISWSTDPDTWENARAELAAIITNSSLPQDITHPIPSTYILLMKKSK